LNTFQANSYNLLGFFYRALLSSTEFRKQWYNLCEEFYDTTRKGDDENAKKAKEISFLFW